MPSARKQPIGRPPKHGGVNQKRGVPTPLVPPRYWAGTLVSLVGEVTCSKTLPLDEAGYTYPTIKVITMKTWRENALMYVYDSWYSRWDPGVRAATDIDTLDSTPTVVRTEVWAPRTGDCARLGWRSDSACSRAGTASAWGSHKSAASEPLLEVHKASRPRLAGCATYRRITATGPPSATHDSASQTPLPSNADTSPTMLATPSTMGIPQICLMVSGAVTSSPQLVRPAFRRLPSPLLRAIVPRMRPCVS